MSMYRSGISRSAAIAIVVIVIVAGIGGILALYPHIWAPPTTTTTTPLTTPTTPFITPTRTTTTTPVSTPTSPPKEIVLRVITRHPYDILDVAKSKFLKSDIAKRFGIKDIQWIPIDPSQWPLYLNQTQKDPAKAICVAWGGGPTLFDYLNKMGYLAPITSSLVLQQLKYIPKEIAGAPMVRYDEKGNIVWIAAAISSFGITTNKEKLKEYGLTLEDVDEWKDLASPIFGVFEPPILGCADATRSTSNTRMYEIIVQRYGWVEGWKIITLLAANAHIYDASGLVRDAVIRGDIAAGITIDFYGYTAQLKNPNTIYIIPKDGSIVNGDPIALLKGCPYPEAAQAFIAWVLSPEGQTVWMDPNVNRLPVNPKVFEVTKEGKERTDLYQAYLRTLNASTINFSDELALSYEEALRWFFHATITMAYTELRKAWTAIAKAYIEGKITDDQLQQLIDVLANPLRIKFHDPKTGEELVFSLSAAQKVNDYMLNPDLRNKIVQEWYESAKKRYAEALNLLKQMIGS